MQTFLAVISVLLGVVTMIQFLVSIATGSSIRARAQAAYNDWYRVAQIADEIVKNPQKAGELIHNLSGMADAARNEIKAYSREKLGFIPWYEPAYESGLNPNPPQNFFQKIKSAFIPK